MPWRLLWRFFTGLHLDGKRRSRGRGAATVLPQYSDYFWNRYSRQRRALWRNLLFWVTLLATFGLIIDRHLTIYAILAFTPFAVMFASKKLLDSLTMVTNWSDSDGVSSKYRILRPKVRRHIARLKPAKIRVGLPDGGEVAPDVQRAILAENAEDHGEPITNLRAWPPIGERGSEDVTGHTSGRARSARRKLEGKKPA
jgi:hypothetical protein